MPSAGGESVITVSSGPEPDGPAWLKEFASRELRARRRDLGMVWVERIVIVVVVLAVWQCLEWFNVISPATISDPVDVVRYFFGTLLEQPSFYTDLWLTFQEMILGLIVGSAAGAVVGVALGLLPRVASAFQPVLVGLNAVPKIALAPLAVVWLGLGIQSKILIAALGVFFVVFFNVIGGLADRDPVLTQNVRMLGLSRFQTLTAVLLPSIGVWVVTALKVAISLALIGAIVGEYVGANAGLGYEINNAINSVQVTRMVALLAVVAIIGCLLYGVISLAEKQILRWR
jgi:NitT/TauT family transport system permease protein